MKRSICSCSNANNRSVKKQVQTKQDEDELPHLPDIVVHKIFRLLPTKLAVRSSIVSKQWASVWSLGVPFLDFDDEADLVDDDDRNMRFIHFVESCLRRFETNKMLESFRFRMRRYDSDLIDATRIDKWLSFALERCVKEIDISIQRKHDDGHQEVESTYYSIPQTIFNSRFLTSLTLEHVIMKKNCPISLPALKTMSLYAVMFDCRMGLDDSIWEDCPSIEHLSLTSCTFSSKEWLHYWAVDVRSSSLKTLQVMHCKFKALLVEAENLESFICTSDIATLRLLPECLKLKYINVNSLHMSRIMFPGRCRDNLRASFDTPAVQSVTYHGYVLPNDVISMKIAPHPLAAYLRFNLDDEEEGQEPIFRPPWIHVPAWRDFLQNFGCCHKVNLVISHDVVAKALTFPESFRKSSSPPLPHVKFLEILIGRLRCSPTVATDFDLMNSLRWMAPHAICSFGYWNDDGSGGPSESEEDE